MEPYDRGWTLEELKTNVGPPTGKADANFRPSFSQKNFPPQALKHFITDCWSASPTDRPEFIDMEKKWDEATKYMNTIFTAKGNALMAHFKEEK